MSEFRVRETEDNLNNWCIADSDTFSDTENYIDKEGAVDGCCVTFDTEAEAQVALDLYLSKQKEKQSSEMRQFGTGASRDADDHSEKPSYFKALSPIVLREYAKYLGRHRTMADGTKRDWNNWKKGLPMDVYADGLLRHTMAVWLILQGYKAYDNHGEVNLKDSLNGVMFATNGMLHEILKDEID